MDEQIKKQHRGFAAMSAEKQREIASKGGKASHATGRGHEWTPADAALAGHKGGLASRGGRGRVPVAAPPPEAPGEPAKEPS